MPVSAVQAKSVCAGMRVKWGLCASSEQYNHGNFTRQGSSAPFAANVEVATKFSRGVNRRRGPTPTSGRSNMIGSSPAARKPEVSGMMTDLPEPSGMTQI
eukprot:658604-Prymnesium_polylepis.1